MLTGTPYLKLLVILVCFFCYCSCNIHRAIPGNAGYQIPVKVRNSGIINEEEDDDDEEPLGFFDRIYEKSNVAWLYAIPAAILVGSTGIFPLLIFKVEEGHELKEAISPARLKLLLSFAVGGLLGDVFLHLLPESWMYLDHTSHDHLGGLKIGLWVLAGFLCFLILEKIFFEEEKVKEQLEQQRNKVTEKLLEASSELNGITNGHVKGDNHDGKANGKVKGVTSKSGQNGKHILKNGETNGDAHKNGITKNGQVESNDIRKRNVMSKKETEESIEPGDADDDIDEERIKVIGYLNLLANCIDNFTHGLAVAGGFIVSVPVGVCTTIAILLHEIPHEIGDFAILLKAGFKRWEAAKGQMITASGALFGCLFGLLAEGAGDSSAWVLPFTSGGFIYIALVTVVPDLLKEEDPKESIKQIVSLLIGLGTMAGVSFLH